MIGLSLTLLKMFCLNICSNYFTFHSFIIKLLDVTVWNNLDNSTRFSQENTQVVNFMKLSMN